MTAREVAELLDVPISSVHEWGRKGTLPRDFSSGRRNTTGNEKGPPVRGLSQIG
jgi:predicted site-specific integrase-resolvase